MRECILSILRQQWPRLLGLAAVIAASIAVSIAPPLVLQRAVDGLAAGNIAPDALLLLGVLYFALCTVSGLIDTGRETLITVLGQKITHGVRSAMCRRLGRLPASYFVAQEPGQVTSLFVNDVDTLENLFDSGIVSMFADAFTIVSILAVVSHLSPGLGVLLLLCLPLLFLLTRYFQRRMLQAQLDNRRAIAKTNALIPETVANIRTIHLCQQESYMHTRYLRAIRQSFAAMERSNFCDSIYSPIILTSGTAIICLTMALSVTSGTLQEFFGMTVGSVVALIAYVRRIFTPLEAIGMEIQSIQSAVAGIRRLQDFFALPLMPEVPKKRADEKAAASSKLPPLVIEDLAFGYGEEPDLFSHLSLTIREGEHLTLTGRTGIGKSTLFKLVLGLYAPRAGSIRIAGLAPAEIAERDRRRLIGCVWQEFCPVRGGIREQVTLGNPGISDEEVRQALALTGLLSLCQSLPQGLATPLKDAGFSQGQLQLLGIARAIVKHPRLLLLDEITASLDAATEKQVLAALKRAAQDRAVLSISHRLYETTGGRLLELRRP